MQAAPVRVDRDSLAGDEGTLAGAERAGVNERDVRLVEEVLHDVGAGRVDETRREEEPTCGSTTDRIGIERRLRVRRLTVAQPDPERPLAFVQRIDGHAGERR